MDKKMAIVILGGGLIKDKKGQWRTTNFNEKGDKFGILGDRLRVEAGNYLYKDNPESLIIASGGKGQLKGVKGAPNLSKIIKKELIELEVEEKRIIEENKSGNTWQQLQELKKIIIKKRLLLVIIISNKYHFLRVKVMIEQDRELKRMLDCSRIKLKTAEEILIKHEPRKWQEIIETAYKSKAMKKRIAREKKGIRQIKNGIYKFR